MESYVLEQETVSIEALAEQFNVSTQTVRRDVTELLKRGNLRKVYGGVSTSYPDNFCVPISLRENRNLDAKNTIGRLAATLVHDDATIFLDSGTTTPCIVPYLALKSNITIVTNNLRVLCMAEKYPTLHLLSLGGYFHSATSSFIGGSIINEINNLVFDQTFFATTGISIEHGLTVNTYYEQEIKRAIFERNKRNIVVLADSSKFDVVALFNIGPYEDISYIVTDESPPLKYYDVARMNNTKILALTDQES